MHLCIYLQALSNENFQLSGETVYSSRESEDGAENRTVERHFGSILIADGSQAINVSAKKDLKRGNIVRFSTLIIDSPTPKLYQ